MAKHKSVNFTLSGKLLKELRKMAKRDGVTAPEELMLAIRDRKYFDDKVREGYNVLIVNNENTVKVNWR